MAVRLNQVRKIWCETKTCRTSCCLLSSVRCRSSAATHFGSSSLLERINKRETTTKSDGSQSTVKQWEDLRGPTNLPLIGCGYKIFRRTEDIHQLTRELVREYGPIIPMKLGPVRTFAVACPKLMGEIIRHEDPVSTRDAPLAWMEYIKAHNGSGALLTSQNESWERKRQSVRNLMLKPTSMENMVTHIAKIGDDFCLHLAKSRDDDGYIPDLPQCLYRFSFEGIVSVLFGERAGCLYEDSHQVGEDFINAVSVILDGTANHLAIFAPIARKFNTAAWQKNERAWDIGLKSARAFMDKMVTRLIAEGTKDERSQLPMALSLLNSHKLSNDDIDYMIMEFLMGGVDTTSNTLGFLLYELASHPEKQQRLRDEVEMVVRECGDNLKLEDLQKMKYFKMCLKETLRLYPILYVNGRSIRSHFISENHNIEFKAKDNIIFLHYDINRNSEIWHRADDFFPERFDRENTDPTSPTRQLVSIPFGHGTRGCIGKRIAEMELSAAVLKILPRFELILGDKYEFKPISRGTLTLGKQIPVKFVDRCTSP